MNIYKPIITFCFLLSATIHVYSQTYGIDAAGEGAGNASVAKTGLSAAIFNQAALAGTESGGRISYQNRFGLKELSQKSAVATVNAAGGTFGLVLNYFGYSLYNETKAGIAYAMKLSPDVSAGIQINYHNLDISEAENRSYAFSGELGIIYKPIKQLSLGAHISNPGNWQYSNTDTDIIPVLFAAGVTYFVDEKALFSLQIERNSLEEGLPVKAGIDFMAVDNFWLRIGASSKPYYLSIGAGYTFKNFTLDISFRRHETLGMISSASLSYLINKSQNTESRKL